MAKKKMSLALQIFIALVLAIIVALAGSAIFASIYLARKNGDKDKKGEDKTPKRF